MPPLPLLSQTLLSPQKPEPFLKQNKTKQDSPHLTTLQWYWNKVPNLDPSHMAHDLLGPASYCLPLALCIAGISPISIYSDKKFRQPVWLHSVLCLSIHKHYTDSNNKNQSSFYFRNSFQYFVTMTTPHLRFLEKLEFQFF